MNENSKRIVHILLVEDDEDDYVITSDALEECPDETYEITWVNDAKSAEASLRIVNFDVVLVDYRLGGDDGLEFLRGAAARYLDTPFIMLTGQAKHALDRDVLDAGATDYLLKSNLEKDTLSRIIRYAIRQKTLEAALRQESQFLEALVSQVGALVIVLGPDGAIQRFNRLCETTSGYAEADVVGRMPWDFLIEPSEQDAARDVYFTLKAGGEPSRHRGHIVARDGSLHLIDWSNTSLRNAKGEVEYVIGTGIDITEKAIVDAERRRLALVAQETDNAVVITDRHGTTEWVNPACERLTGYTMEEMIGQVPGRLLQGPETDPATVARIRDALSKCQPLSEEIVNYTKTGEPYWIELNIRPVYGDEGQVNQFFGINRNITEQKRNEARRLREQQLALFRAELGERLASEPDLETLLAGCAQHVVTHLDAAMANIWLLDPDGQSLTFHAGAGCPPPPRQSAGTVSLGSPGVGQVAQLRTPVTSQSASPAEFTDEPTWAANEGIAFFAGFPLLAENVLYGVIGVYARTPLPDDSLETLATMASALANAVARSQAIDKLQQHERQLENLVAKRTQDLAEAREFSDHTLQSLTEDICVLDERGRVVFVNRDHSSFGSLPDIPDPNTSVGQNYLALCGRARMAGIENGERIEAGVHALLSGDDGNFDCEYPCRYRNEQRWYILRATRFNTGNGVRVVIAHVDVTARRQAQDALSESEERLRLLLETAGEGIFGVNARRVCTFVNNACATMLGYTANELIDRVMIDLVQLTPDGDVQTAREGSGIDAAIAQGLARYNADGAFKRKDGTYLPVEYTSVPIRQGNAIIGAVVVFHDVTERRETERALFEAKELAIQASRAKSVFLANMSHEIRTPMNAILGFSRMLQQNAELQGESREFVDTISRSGEYLLSLINNILEMSKIEAGRIELEPYHFDLRALFKELSAMFRLRAEEKGLAFHVDLSDDTPQYVLADELRLKQTLINLLGNAMKFTESGAVTLRTHVTATDGAWMLTCDVEDTGPGIAPDELPNVFQHFEQTESGRRHKAGTGLGLAISREYARLMGGDIAVESTPSVGSTFSLRVVVHQGANAPEETGPHARTVAGIAEDRSPLILVADDNDANRRLLHVTLRRAGFRVLECDDGAKAVRSVSANDVDLVLMDMEMPVLNGYEATRRIKALTGKATVPVVGVTASVFREHRDQVLAAGADAFIRKPYLESEIFETIAGLLNLNYVYKDATDASERHSAVGGTELSPNAVSVLPRNLLEDLRVSAMSCHAGRCQELLDSLDDGSTPIVQSLQTLVNSFDFERLGTLIDEALEGTGTASPGV